MLRRRGRAPRDRPAWFEKVDGRWTPTSWRRFAEGPMSWPPALRRLGLSPGDRVAIVGPTRAAWALQDMGAQLAGCVSLGIYPKQSVEQVAYVIGHSDARVVFVGDEAELDVVLAAVADLPGVEAIVPWDAAWIEGRDEPRLRPLASLTGTPLTPAERAQVEAARGTDDTAIFVYTSGTTGPPKCAMISHRNILAVLGCQNDLGVFYQDDIALSFLPMAHVAERVLAFYGRINTGMPTAYATSTSAVLDELREVQPTVFGSVPRIFEKAYSRIQSDVAKAPPGKRRVFAWADRVGRARLARVLAGKPVPVGLRLKHRVADRLVFSKVRAAFGGRVRLFITGAAPTPMDVLEFFWAAGLPIYEVYGQTEATVVTHANTDGHVRLGTVGRALPPVEHRIAPDGEVLVRGPLVFQGYFKDPEATAAAIQDGWLHTGDIGSLDADGYLRITDRKKHIIITAGGKNLTPANIEAAVKTQDALISHVHAHGDKRPYVVALIAPSPLETLDFGLQRGLVDKATVAALTAELMENPTGRSAALTAAMAPVVALPDFQARMKAAVVAGNKRLSQVEKIKRFKVLERDFSQEAGELTPTMKVRRKAIETAYAELLELIYTEPGVGGEA
ncbi:MAG: long-chain fatty acid--CoA ligase [bacterium]